MQSGYCEAMWQIRFPLSDSSSSFSPSCREIGKKKKKCMLCLILYLRITQPIGFIFIGQKQEQLLPPAFKHSCWEAKRGCCMCSWERGCDMCRTTSCADGNCPQPKNSKVPREQVLWVFTYGIKSSFPQHSFFDSVEFLCISRCLTMMNMNYSGARCVRNPWGKQT